MSEADKEVNHPRAASERQNGVKKQKLLRKAWAVCFSAAEWHICEKNIIRTVYLFNSCSCPDDERYCQRNGKAGGKSI